MSASAEILKAIADKEPFVLVSRDQDSVELLRGEIVDVELLKDIPLWDGDKAKEIFAMIPYRQVVERGFDCHDDKAPLRCMIIEERIVAERQELIQALPEDKVSLENPGFDISDDEYAALVRQVIDDEIGQGEGANFVIRRDFTAQITSDPTRAALSWFRALLAHERGAYWTFLVSSEDLIAVGASPEAHVSVSDGTVTMNPISGTFRHPESGANTQNLAEFLRSTKETEELFMVVDEELKMMSAVCSDGGRITGPQLKEMSRLTHTEYVLRGKSQLDPRDILRETMFAPTVTGSPMQNACTIIAKHEREPRGYYSGVAALFTPNNAGGHDLDAPILIRTAYLRGQELRVPVGATLVRHSDPMGEVSETHGKAAGVLGAIGAIERSNHIEEKDAPVAAAQLLGDDPEIAALLASRNERLATFWLNPQSSAPEDAPFNGLTAVVVDAEDRFTTMLAHQLRHLGLETVIKHWSEIETEDLADYDLVIAGPGPGDPRDNTNPRIAKMRSIVASRRQSEQALLAVCLSHQILSDSFGLDLVLLEQPHQGLQKTVDIFGEDASIGFYNTFTARKGAPALESEELEIAADETSGDVYALRGNKFASVQGHLESILSRDGMHTLERLISHALN